MFDDELTPGRTEPSATVWLAQAVRARNGRGPPLLIAGLAYGHLTLKFVGLTSLGRIPPFGPLVGDRAPGLRP